MCTSPVTGAPGQVQGFAIPVAAIKPDGSISGSITQSGAFAGLAATITYSVSGHMAKATATAAASGTGTYREDIVLKDSSKRTCTSNNQPWTVPKAGPIPQAKSMLAAGKYSDGYFTLSVSGSKVLDLTNYVVNITCLPAVTGAPGQVQGFAIPEATINADGSFTGKATQERRLCRITGNNYLFGGRKLPGTVLEWAPDSGRDVPRGHRSHRFGRHAHLYLEHPPLVRRSQVAVLD